ncbi:MAG: nucleotidyl transferase AbiEii/AbiGii toxin family protein [Nitrospirae bacterium]|nr:nucleotidyl transferase AbiEii/AbiGii toxin family protein [Nitrospirota bacterium]
MIATHCFQKDWALAKRSELGGGDPTLIEKTVHAFALLCHLAHRGVPMVFKGGTSLILRLPRFRRLSIDIDILCPLPDNDLDTHLKQIALEPPFIRYEEDDRGHDRLPARRHFKFYYNSAVNNNSPEYVLLDVVKEEAQHPYVENIVIASSLFDVTGDIRVDVPVIESLLGDKLTAFAPCTVGVPCTPDYAMQVMKQLFDVGVLFDVASDFGRVAQAYDAIFAAENMYRDGAHTVEAALNDSIETARLIGHFGLKGSAQNEQQILLERGRSSLTSHLCGTSFSGAQAKVAAAKAAYLATCLRDRNLDGIIRRRPFNPDGVGELREIVLPDLVLQRLRGGNPEAFYYWALALGLLS